MNPRLSLGLRPQLTLCASFLLSAISLSALAAAATPPPGTAGNASPKVIPWSEVGVTAGAQYSGDGLTIISTEHGARLHCVFQRLNGEATREGLWLTSTVNNQANDHFRVTAVAIGEKAIPLQGEIAIDGQTVRFTRPGLIEEYSVSMGGVRQDFIITQRPVDANKLHLGLAVTGAQVEQTAYGAQLVLESGRKIAYSRLRVTDANGQELPSRIEVTSSSPLRTALTAMVVVVYDANAVYPIRIDPTFSDANWISMNPSIPGADDTVRAAVVDNSGNLYIGGQFTLMGDVVANYIAKWDGSRWSALGSGTDFYVNALAVSGSDLYVGGIFTKAGGVSATNIAKWNGSTWSSVGTGISAPSTYPYYDGSVDALAVSGNDLYAGGWFTTAGGTAATNVAKWNGSTWSNLGPGISGSVSALAAAGSTLYAGGFFTTAGGVSASKIARWNGSSWSSLGSGLGGWNYNNEVLALAVSGGDLYAAGLFQMAGGIAATNIAKWNGSSWSPLGAGTDSFVFALAVSGNDLYAGGHFESAEGSPARRIAKWDGTSWSALSAGMDGTVYTLALSGSNLYGGGAFTSAGGNAVNGIAKWQGSSWTALGSGVNGAVFALGVSGSNVYVGGGFSIASGSGSQANRIARWDGSNWSALGVGISAPDDPPYYGGSVRALAVLGSDLYTGGNFTNAGGIPADHIAKWNGSNWSALGSGMDEEVRALAVLNTNLYAGGGFTTAGGVSANYIAKWNGSSWDALGAGMDGAVYALATSGGDLYAGGNFTTAGGLTVNNIAKWDGSGWSALGSGVNSSVEALAVSGGNLYVGGWFNIAGGAPARSVAKWDGSTWVSMGSGVNGYQAYDGPTVFALTVSGNDVYAAGGFTSAGGSPANFIAKWNGSSWSALGSGINNPVFALAVSGSDLYVGGSFTAAGGKISAFVSRVVLGDAPGYNQLDGKLLSSGAMKLSYVGYPATNYALDRTFNLSPPVSWLGQQTNTMTVSGVLMFTNTPVADTNNFWRVRSAP